MFKNYFSNLNKSKIAWRGLFLLSFSYGFLFIFMEWLYQITKPSFMSDLNFPGKIEILLFVGSLTTSIGLIFVSLFFLLLKISWLKRFEHSIFLLACLTPSIILSTLILILVDNFLYTITRFGIVSSEGFWRGVWSFTFVVILILIFRSTAINASTWENKLFPKTSNRVIFLTIIFFLDIAICFPIVSRISLKNNISNVTPSYPINELPNIILITADALNSEHMSLYGYERDTTPFLSSIAHKSLLSENNFTNSSMTTGSITSIFTGKYPTTTRVVFLPNILRKEDSIQHLPGLLNSVGYYVVQMGRDRYVDGFSVNMKNGFDVVNGQVSEGKDLVSSLNSFLPDESSYFFYECYDRILTRILHIFYISKMMNAFFVIIDAEAYTGEDYENLDKIKDIIKNVDQPCFIHLHWMGTHGPKYYPSSQVFSIGSNKDSQPDYGVDLYDDSILEFDHEVEDLFQDLIEENPAKKFLFIIASDHGQGYVTDVRLPLLIHFPDDAYAKEIKNNTQNLDISPTIIDYLGIENPEWMQGTSLLREIDVDRPIISLGIEGIEASFGVLTTGQLKPPFYQFGYITIIECDHWNRLNLINGYRFEQGSISSYNSQCPKNPISDKEVIELMVKHLKDNQFDTKTLEKWVENEYISK